MDNTLKKRTDSQDFVKFIEEVGAPVLVDNNFLDEFNSKYPSENSLKYSTNHVVHILVRLHSKGKISLIKGNRKRYNTIVAPKGSNLSLSLFDQISITEKYNKRKSTDIRAGLSTKSRRESLGDLLSNVDEVLITDSFAKQMRYSDLRGILISIDKLIEEGVLCGEVQKTVYRSGTEYKYISQK
jgi:hypothetical protein